MDVFEAIRTKRAVREFTDQPVPEETIRQIVDAGRRAQSSKNTQPWRFIVVRDRAKLQALSRTGVYAGHLARAAFAIALISSVEWAFDTGQAAAYLQLAAWDLGVGSCLASIYEPDQAKTILGVPAEQFFRIAISFGYPAQPAGPAKPGGRRPLDVVVGWDHW